MAGRTISEAEFDDLLRSFEHSAFRLEVRDTYALGYERADFDKFLAGTPAPPVDVDWWQPWLDQIKRLTSEGRIVSRVRILAEPPSDYQRWELWAAPWHAEAGERIGYMTRSRAEALGLPTVDDWWLLDGKHLIWMRFTEAGEIRDKTLITDHEMIHLCMKWRDLAVRNATTAEAIAAA